MVEDLTEDTLVEILGDRPVRAYPALLSTDADARKWAREGAPEGALVVADYQASPRGRQGIPWEVRPGRGLAFSLVLRPQLPAEREGWLYPVVTLGIADLLDAGGQENPRIMWPDEVYVGDRRAGAVGVHVELGAEGPQWAVVSVLLEQAEPPRGPVLGRVLDAIEDRYAADPDTVLGDYGPRSRTLGMKVVARLVPLGPAGPTVTGTAVDFRPDGSLVLETDAGHRVAVPPQNLGVLEESL